jgi:threonine dehydrogenase-like Zn-dependent dehydrogenase
MITPDTQTAVQLTGPETLELNEAKEVHAPRGAQILAKVQAVGLCFSDLKLLKQFDRHPRKGPVVSGIDPQVLDSLPSYVPGDKPTVPGHEVVAEIVAVGPDATHHKVGERVMVQADYRPLKTAGSNGAFGYNFEGGLQEYILLDERIVYEPDTGQRYLIPVKGSGMSASSVALVEPWACVENSYATAERSSIRAGGRLLVVAEDGHDVRDLDRCLSGDGKPGEIVAVVATDSQADAISSQVGVDTARASDIDALPDEGFDDIVCFGARKPTLDALNDKIAKGGILAVVTGGKTIGQKVSVGVGRVHYGPTRWVGTSSASAAEAYATIPQTGEIRKGETVVVVGAGGPMGQMHTIRTICSGIEGVSVIATDLDDERLASLEKKAGPLAKDRGVDLQLVNTRATPLSGGQTYFALMAPIGALVEQAIDQAGRGALINIFAGIPAPTRHDLDLDAYIEKGCFMFGTSGSTIDDMHTVLGKVVSGQLDTDTSVDAVSGMAGAVEGIAAVENRTMAGKIIVYPQLRRLGLTPLHELSEVYPTVAENLRNGVWTAEAEKELLSAAE